MAMGRDGSRRLRLWSLMTPLLMLAAGATAQMGPPGGGSGGGPGGGGPGGGGPGGGGRGQGAAPRPPKPLKLDKFDKVVTAMFRSADTNGDGTVTFDELRAITDSKRETLIRARFARIDHDHNGQIDLDEFTRWQRSLGSVALSETQPNDGGIVREEIAPDIGKGDDARLLGELVEPLSATVLVNANVNYDAGVTLDELLAYERKRFDKLDANHDGEISMDEARAASGNRRGPRDGGPDDRGLGDRGPADRGPPGGGFGGPPPGDRN